MRFIEQITKEICNENMLNYESFCDGYCIKVTKNNKFTYIYESVFNNNSAALYKILKDKTAVFEILSKYNIPCVEHFYLKPNNTNDLSYKDTLKNYLIKYNSLVLKYVEGMSGNDVFFIDNEKQLMQTAESLLSKYGSFSISPFYDINHEYRVIVLNGEIQIVFDKIRPFVLGDGIHTIKELALQKYSNKIKIDANIDSNQVLENKKTQLLSWRHNLNYGSIPEIITNKDILNSLDILSHKVIANLGIKYATIDIIDTNGDYKILEINGSITMGKFASFSKENYILTKEIYKKALLENLK